MGNKRPRRDLSSGLQPRSRTGGVAVKAKLLQNNSRTDEVLAMANKATRRSPIFGLVRLPLGFCFTGDGVNAYLETTVGTSL